ncbi:MAG TPA: hypothetical protein GXX40_08680 [Firmicutes bacterium]|nr:hypothetical protein [Bacillota bacterium]
MQFLPYLSPDLDGFSKMPHAAKLLYLVAQICEVESLADLARRAGVSERTAIRMNKLLCKHKWFRTERRGNKVVPIPVLPRAEDERRARIFRACYEVSPFKGEFIMGSLLNATLFLEDKVDNARPDFLKNPVTGENLEYDVFSPTTKSAWEFQGFQHFGPTEVFPSKEKAKQQQANDLIKLGRSVENGVTLVVMTYKDLSLDGILKNLPAHLRKKPIDRTSRYIRTIENVAADYRRWAARIEGEMQGKSEAPSPAAGQS